MTPRIPSLPHAVARALASRSSTIERSAGVTNLRQVSSPTICSWTGLSTSEHGGIVDISYGWLKKNSLMFDREIAIQLGYHTENMVTESFGGFYWHDPDDPGTCGVSAADCGTVTWWIHHRNHSPQPDACATAWQLIFDTVELVADCCARHSATQNCCDLRSAAKKADAVVRSRSGCILAR
ncbi:DUF3558 family protein [Nocardia sp. NPDC050710]|uniref:DUF3558 family protein n=1 Tax=Nocardia sp. NPDC050710 TaxID=3157220 RepID=UPI0033F2D4DF